MSPGSEGWQGQRADGFDVPPVPASYPLPATPRAPVGYQPAEPGWWLASDGLWYPPESAAGQPPSGAGTSYGVPPTGGWQPQGPVSQHPYPSIPQVAVGPPKSKVAAGLLALFLGTLGIHRFYLGYNGIGVAMLLISVLSLGLLAPFVAIWALVECVLIFTGSINDSNGRPLV